MSTQMADRTAKGFVFLQLIVRPSFIQQFDKKSSIVMRSNQLSERRAISSAYSNQSPEIRISRSSCSRQDGHHEGRLYFDVLSL